MLCVATLNGTRPNTQNTRTDTQIYEEEGPSEASSIVFRVEQQGGDIKRKSLPLHLIQTKGEYCRILNSFPLPSGSFVSPCIVVRSTQYSHPRRVFLLAILVVLCTDGQHHDDGDSDVDNGRWVTSLQAGEVKRPVDFGERLK